MTFSTITDEANEPIAVLLLAHGAGAGMDSDFMADMARRIAAIGVTVVRFNFPYMQTIAQTGKRRPPDKVSKLEEHFLAQIAEVAKQHTVPLFIGGKSMGGRVATMVLARSNAKAAVALGYPFHPPGKPDKLRTEHLLTEGKPILVMQGERDTFGTQNEIQQYGLPDRIECQFLPDGDHSLKPRKASGFNYEDHMQTTAEAVVAFIRSGV